MSDEEAWVRIGSLDAVRVGSERGAQSVVVLLHGLSMSERALSVFAAPLGVRALFFFPRGPIAYGAGYSYWTVDEEARRASLAAGPRDLEAHRPAGLEAARAAFDEVMMEARRIAAGRPVVGGGFSQGAMIACDALFRRGPCFDALLAYSGSRVGGDARGARTLEGLPALVSHGTLDDDLAFEAGDALRLELAARGADVTWVPFEGGHEVPLLVWKKTRRFLERLQRATSTK